MIALDAVDKVFATDAGETIHALRNVTFEVGDGEFATVVGPSGCGKTTLMRIIAGIIPKSGGHIRLNGQEITGPNPRIGIVFQSPVLFPWRTVYENILLPIDVRRKPRLQSRDVATALIKLVGLEGCEDLHPYEMSGGMQQRAALCRAMIADPSILLMDEPFGALDAMTREQMNLWLQDVWLKSKKTVFFITHSIPEAVFLGDCVIVVTKGPGTVDEILEIDIPRPRPLEVMNTEKFGGYVRRIRGKFGSVAAID